MILPAKKACCAHYFIDLYPEEQGFAARVEQSTQTLHVVV
jgi:hypothetical protein